MPVFRFMPESETEHVGGDMVLAACEYGVECSQRPDVLTTGVVGWDWEVADVEGTKADKTLIAAAPELLEALKEMLRGCGFGLEPNEDILNQARRAVRKAEG